MKKYFHFSAQTFGYLTIKLYLYTIKQQQLNHIKISTVKKFNEESVAAINTISKAEIEKGDLVKCNGLLTISSLSHTLRMYNGVSGWAKIDYMKMGGYIFGFCSDKIFWCYPIMEENGGFDLFEYTPKIQYELEGKINNILNS